MPDVNPRSQQPNNSVEPGTSPLPIPPSSAPSTELADAGPPAGLAPAAETLQFMRERLSPDIEMVEVPGWMGNDNESGTAFIIPPDGKKENLLDRSGPRTGSAIER